MLSAQRHAQIYLAVLVMITQRLALCADINTERTLTAIHDKSNAWLGIGSAVVSGYHQLELMSTSGVACIGGYLAGVAVLHVSIPAMLHAENFNDTSTQVISTTLANQTYGVCVAKI